MAIQATAVSRVILTRLHGNRVQSMYVAAWRWKAVVVGGRRGEPEHEQELAHACARTESLYRTEGNHNLPSCVRDAAFFFFLVR